MVDGLDAFDTERVAGGEFALGDGEVDDVVGAGDVTAGVDVAGGGLLPAVGFHATGVGEFHAGGGEIETGGVGLATEGVKKMAGATDAGFATAGEFDDDASFVAGDGGDFCVGVETDAVVAERLLDDLAGGGGVVFKNVFAALDERDLGADAAEELGEFAGDDAAAEDDHALGDEIEIEDVVAGPEF